MDLVRDDILHKTAVEIEALSPIMTRPRFIEITGKTPVDLLTETSARHILAHLQLLSVEYHNVINDIIETIEDNQNEDFLNPRRIAEAAARKIIDRRSREIWQTPNKTL